MKTVLITCVGGAFDGNLYNVFRREGYETFAMGENLPHDLTKAAEIVQEKIGKLDFLVDTTDYVDPDDDFSIAGTGIDTDIIERTFRENVLRPMAILEAFLPLLDTGYDKRLFYLSAREASINEKRSSARYAYSMSKAALHQFIQTTRNVLVPDAPIDRWADRSHLPPGYTFRVFDPMHGKIAPEISAESAFLYITRRRGTENDDPFRDDENNLVMRDAEGRQVPW